MSRSPFRPFLAVLAATLLIPAACEDKSPLEPDDVDDIDRIQLAVGQQTIEIDDDDVTGDPIIIAPGGELDLTATFFDDDDDELRRIDTNRFRLEIVPENGAVMFTRTGPFAGVLTGTTEDVTTISVCVLEISTGECRVGPFDVIVQVEA